MKIAKTRFRDAQGKSLDIIDAHLHTNFNKKEFIDLAKENKINFSLDGLRDEMKKNNVVSAVSMTDHFEQETPLGFEEIKEQCSGFNAIIPCLGINPFKISNKALKVIEEGIMNKKIRGIKIYLGYYPFYANDKIYHPFYRIAAKYEIPVIFHTGDTLLKTAKLKYSLPLSVDEVAVDFPETTFIIAHIGNPWIEDAAAVAYKNKNVYVDLSGLYSANNPLEKELIKRIRNAFLYVEDSSKFLYGSDWPVARMDDYIKFIKKCILAKYYNEVFYLNAKRIFKI